MRVLYQSDPSGEDPHRYLVLEHEPMQILAALGGSDEIFHLWTPYIVQIVRMDHLGLRLLARPGPVTDDDDRCYILGWPHMSPDGSVCYHPNQFMHMYNTLRDTPAQTDIATAEAVMQIFLNGGSSYFLNIGVKDLPVEIQPNMNPKELVVETFFRAWESLDRDGVLALSYQPWATLTDILEQTFAQKNYQLPALGAMP